MSLNIYVGKENLPKDKKLIYDVNSFFMAVPVIVDNFSKKVIREIDRGELLDEDSFIDRFGYKLRLNDCSTGSKILLSVNYSDYIILGDEMGPNCEELLFNITDGSIYFTGKGSHFDLEDREIDVVINGISCKNNDNLYFAMEDIMRRGSSSDV